MPRTSFAHIKTGQIPDFEPNCFEIASEFGSLLGLFELKIAISQPFFSMPVKIDPESMKSQVPRQIDSSKVQEFQSNSVF